MILASFQQQGFLLTHFQPMFHFYTPWKHQKTFSFLMYSAGIKVELIENGLNLDS